MDVSSQKVRPDTQITKPRNEIRDFEKIRDFERLLYWKEFATERNFRKEKCNTKVSKI
jgi:hypothetical protein